MAWVEVSDPRHVRFKLKQPWLDFLTFYASATAAGWVVPRKYVEKVGEAEFKKAPVGAGPYKFVSFTPGVELVLEAFDQYWRKPASVKRLVFSYSRQTTRLGRTGNAVRSTSPIPSVGAVADYRIRPARFETSSRPCAILLVLPRSV
jgi:ABC-type transport system substrate-binding protein